MEGRGEGVFCGLRWRRVLMGGVGGEGKLLSEGFEVTCSHPTLHGFEAPQPAGFATQDWGGMRRTGLPVPSPASPRRCREAFWLPAC